jgi:16S rRNA (cytidine1402-2'-O)-methyltransferase
LNHLNVKLAPGLYFVATPIGTARDITLRALDILASADLIAAEDTRSLRRLMDIHGVPLNGRRILSYHDHSGANMRQKLLAALAQGGCVAYASEAGMPLIADPGFDLSRAAAEAGFAVTSAPGPSAVLAALTLAGLPTDAFFFGGFLPSARTARKARLEALSGVPGTLVLFESPKRVAACLADMAEVLGADRSAALCRELTKKFEEIRRDTLGQLAADMADASVRGEIVLVVDRNRSHLVNEIDLESDLQTALGQMSLKDAVAMVSDMHGVKRRMVYQMALKLGKKNT